MIIETKTGVEEEEGGTIVTLSTIWYHLYNLKNGKKHAWRSVTLIQVAELSL